MEIQFEQFKGESGLNIWAKRLCHSLNSQNIHCSINFHPFYQQFIPSGYNKKIRNDSGLIQHTTSWSGWSFKSKQPLVVTEHTAVHEKYLNQYKTLSQHIYHTITKKYEYKSIKCANRITSVSLYAKKCLEKNFDYFDSELIYNGIDTDIFKPELCNSLPTNIEPKKAILFFAGNLTTLKGADLLPKIMKNLGTDYLLLITSGFRQNVPIRSTNIMNIGTLNESDLNKVYNQCDIFLTTSRVEGFGLSVAEAMACGKPVVATNCSSLPELVVDGKGGFLCQMDDVKDFADKIRHLAADEDLRREMGMFNRKRVEEKFEISRMVREYSNLYKSL
jgi:glycosyltransferase involved in cell wall biosynthesis